MNRKEIEEFTTMKNDIEHIKQHQEEMVGKLDKFIEAADGKYASKKIELAFYWLAGLIGTAVVGAIMKIIIIG